MSDETSQDRYWIGPREGKDRWGVFDRKVSDWVATFTGRDAQQQAESRYFELEAQRRYRPHPAPMPAAAERARRSR